MRRVYTFNVDAPAGQDSAILAARRLLRAEGEEPSAFHVTELERKGDHWFVVKLKRTPKR